MIRLEHVGDGSVADRNFQALMQLVIDTGGITASVRFGVQALTFTASTNSATASVDHGLGRVPVGGFAQAIDSPAFGKIPNPNMANFSDVSFNLNAELVSAHTGDINVFWLVIG